MPPRDWHHLAQQVRDRREELGLTQENLAALGGPSTATLRLIENAAARSYRAKTLRQLEAALGWQEQSARRILAGLKPVLLDDIDSQDGHDPVTGIEAWVMEVADLPEDEHNAELGALLRKVAAARAERLAAKPADATTERIRRPATARG